MWRHGIVLAACAAMLVSASPSPYFSQCERECTTITACQRLNEAGTKVSTAQTQKATFMKLVDLMSSPDAVNVVVSGQLPDIFAPDVRGRVNPVGEVSSAALPSAHARCGPSCKQRGPSHKLTSPCHGYSRLILPPASPARAV
jgi:hypothetical protein